MLRKDPLGKGLSAILKDIEEKGVTKIIPVKEIVAGRTQPRFEIKDDSIVELAASIREKGLLQPVILRKYGNSYEIVAGERRYRASIMAGLNEIPAIVKDIDDKEALEIAMIENLQRVDLNAVEVAVVYERFVEEFGYTHEELSKRIGINRSSVTNFIRLLKLPEWTKKLIVEGKLSQGHARVLITLKSENEQKRFVDKVLKEGVSVRELEREVKKKSAGKSSPFPYVEESLRERLGTKVDITYRKNKGKIIIEFYSPEDLERITESISPP